MPGSLAGGLVYRHGPWPCVHRCTAGKQLNSRLFNQLEAFACGFISGVAIPVGPVSGQSPSNAFLCHRSIRTRSPDCLTEFLGRDSGQLQVRGPRTEALSLPV